MVRRFEELDWQETPLGEISLRRRYDLTAQADVYEVRLGEEYLMSSLFTTAERALATLALEGLEGLEGERLRVLVGVWASATPLTRPWQTTASLI